MPKVKKTDGTSEFRTRDLSIPSPTLCRYATLAAQTKSACIRHAKSIVGCIRQLVILFLGDRCVNFLRRTFSQPITSTSTRPLVTRRFLSVVTSSSRRDVTKIRKSKMYKSRDPCRGQRRFNPLTPNDISRENSMPPAKLPRFCDEFLPIRNSTLSSGGLEKSFWYTKLRFGCHDVTQD